MGEPWLFVNDGRDGELRVGYAEAEAMRLEPKGPGLRRDDP
jgi:hypothetical protein